MNRSLGKAPRHNKPIVKEFDPHTRTILFFPSRLLGSRAAPRARNRSCTRDELSLSSRDGNAIRSRTSRFANRFPADKEGTRARGDRDCSFPRSDITLQKETRPTARKMRLGCILARDDPPPSPRDPLCRPESYCGIEEGKEGKTIDEEKQHRERVYTRDRDVRGEKTRERAPRSYF